MRFLNCLYILIILASCDSISIRYTEGECMKHKWWDDIYKVGKIDGLDIEMKNMSGGKDKTISKLDKGWSFVSCPLMKGK